MILKFRFTQITSPDYLYGINPVMTALNAQRRQFAELYINENQTNNLNPRIANIMNTANKMKIPIVYKSKSKIEQICGKDQPHQNVILKCSALQYVDQIIGNNIVLLDQITDPHNFGAILRTAFFLGINDILVEKKNTCSLTATVSKTSSGAVEMMNIYRTNDIVQFVKDCKERYVIIGTGLQKSTPLNEVKVSPRQIIIFGSESTGVQRDLLNLCDVIVKVPGARKEFPESLVDSLNVSVSAGISSTNNSIENPNEVGDWSGLVDMKLFQTNYGYDKELYISPDGRFIACKQYQNISIIETKTGQEISNDKLISPFTNVIGFSLDSRYLIYADIDLRIRLWDIQNQRVIQEFGPTVLFMGLAMSQPISSIFVYYTEDNYQIIQDYKSSNGIKILENLQRIDYQQNGQIFYSRMFLKEVHVIDSRKDYSCYKLMNTKRKIHEIRCSPNGKMLIVDQGKKKRLHLYDLKSKKQLRRFDEKYNYCPLQFSPNCNRVLCCIREGVHNYKMRILNLTTGIYFELKYQIMRSKSFYFSPDDMFVLFTDQNNEVCVRRIEQI